MFSVFFHEVFYQPLYNVILFFYNTMGNDFGIAIILTTLLLKVVLIPLTNKQIESQKKLQEIQPKIKAIQEKYKDNKERQTKEVMQFYKENKVNPFGGCLPLIIQMFFFFAIYRILLKTATNGFEVIAPDLYSFVANPGSINHFFLHVVDLSVPSSVLAALTAVAQYVQLKMMTKNQQKPAEQPSSSEPDIAAIMNKQMVVLMPAMILIFGIKLAAALTLYWFVSTLFMIGQQQYILKVRRTREQ